MAIILKKKSAAEVPTPPTSKVTLYISSTDGYPHVKDETGTDTSLVPVPVARTLTAGAGLTGGGDLTANRTFDVVANADGSIVVNANDIQVGVINDAQHGSRAGGTLHPDVVAAGASGFMSGADKTKLNAITGTNTGDQLAGAGLTGTTTLNVIANADGSIIANANDIQVGVINDTQHGSRSGGSLHPVASTTVAGFMSASDRVQLNNQYYDVVADGGADPTGSVDATAIIQAANDSFGSTGGIIFFPVGTYKVSATININKKVTLRGANREQTVISMTHASQDVFNVTANFVRFETIRIVGATAGTRTGGFAINFHLGADNCSCQWVDVLFMWSAVAMSGQLCRLEDMNIREMGANAINGCLILIDQFKDQYIRSVISDNPSNPTGFAGVRVTNLSSLIMSDCDFIHAGTCLDLAPTTTNTIPSIFVNNTFFDNSATGASFTGAAGTIQRVHFTNCWFATMSGNGVTLNAVNTNEISFVNCQFYQCAIGIQALAATDWVVRSSVFAGNTTCAIQTTAAATHSFTIADNFIGAIGGFAANAQGINVQAGTYKRYAVVDNRGFDTNTTKGWIDLGLVAAADQKVTGPNIGGLLAGAMASVGADVTSVNTTEFSLVSARIPANSVKIGDTFRIRMFGLSNGAGTLIFRIRIGANGAAAPASDNQACINVATAAQVANQRASIDGLVTVKTIGGAGTVAGEFVGMANAINISPTVAAAATATAVTTADWFITLSVVVSASTFTARNAVIEVI